MYRCAFRFGGVNIRILNKKSNYEGQDAGD